MVMVSIEVHYNRARRPLHAVVRRLSLGLLRVPSLPKQRVGGLTFDAAIVKCLLQTMASRSRFRDLVVSPMSITAGLRSVLNWLNTKSLKSFKAVLHGFERFSRMPLPIRDLARNP